jgi:hypothetical protein
MVILQRVRTERGKRAGSYHSGREINMLAQLYALPHGARIKPDDVERAEVGDPIATGAVAIRRAAPRSD